VASHRRDRASCAILGGRFSGGKVGFRDLTSGGDLGRVRPRCVNAALLKRRNALILLPGSKGEFARSEENQGAQRDRQKPEEQRKTWLSSVALAVLCPSVLPMLFAESVPGSF
jgi:hypothetical protein